MRDSRQRSRRVGSRPTSKKASRATPSRSRQEVPTEEAPFIQTLDFDCIPIARVSIMGRPNVGKSSLFNRLHQKNLAITSPLSGTTRDLNKRNLKLGRHYISLIDTGGLDPAINPKKPQNEDRARPKNPTKDQAKIAAQLKDEISMQSYGVVAQSDLIIYVVDGRAPLDEADISIFRSISQHRPSILVLNKVDNEKLALDSYDFARFGVELLMLSVLQNRGVAKLIAKLEESLDSLLEANQLQKSTILVEGRRLDSKLALGAAKESLDGLKDENDLQAKEEVAASLHEGLKDIGIGIIGRPNVGKSSLLNALTNSNRALVSPVAGTTIDPVDESIIHGGARLTFIDTAGLRRRSKIEGLEKYALDRTKKVLQQCHIALLVLDSSEEFVELDEKLSALASEARLGLIVVLTKWDARRQDFENIKKDYARKFRFLEYAPLITVSSITKRHIHDLKQKILQVYNNFCFRLPTARLNECLERAMQRHPVPSDHGKFIRIYYATQFDTRPPRIALIMNRARLHFSYRRYIVNVLRQEFGFEGVPIILELRERSSGREDANAP